MDMVRVYDKQELENINKVLRKDKNNKYFTQQELEIANEINQRKEDKCMNNKLELVKSFKFNEVECNIYSKDNEMFMTGEQLGEVLGYSETRKSIGNIVNRNEYLKDKEFSSVIKMMTLEGNRYVNRETRIFTEDGIYEITMLSKTETGKKFRKVVREVIKSLRKGENSLDTNGLMKQLTESQITLNNVLAGFKMQIDNDFKIANEKITEHDELLKKRVYLSPKEAKDVQIAIKNKAKQIAIEFDLPYHTVKGKLFKRLYTSLNEIFEVGTYRELPSIKYEDIMHTISGLTIGIRDIQNEVYQTSLYN